jgi:hypothetical protein
LARQGIADAVDGSIHATAHTERLVEVDVADQFNSMFIIAGTPLLSPLFRSID